ncbi:agamous-like MADS-box protein AGL92 isoform X1 [Papaver somniferum]|uniref:agamous-like MADS-box protein AGL92 isoform X1 n=1 Tax=Papaver somniferum TaxID=3469 RepID=UPI000E704016|nr:agamous-like MADS-box protein AGL92 isoform X1 [Papaver somniferum]
MGCNERGKSSSSSINNVDHKIRRKSFKNRIKGFEKKFYELRTLCDVKAAAVVYSEFMNGAKSLPVNPREFDEVVMLKKFYDQKKMKSKNQRFCNFDNLSTVESLERIERDLESKFNMISEREKQLKAGVASSSSSSSSSNCCYQDDEMKKNFGVFNSTNCESSSLVVGSVYEHGSSSSDVLYQQQPQPLITFDPAGLTTTTAADNMFCDYEPRFADMIELEFQRLNCSTSYMDMMMNTTSPFDGPEFLLC